jgi:hypothetical protein
MVKKLLRFSGFPSSLILSAVFAFGCAPAADPLQKTSIVDSVNLALSQGDCSTALNTVQTYYNSAQSDNSIRTAMASTYGCFAGVEMLQIINDLVNFPGDIGGSGFWEFLVQEFPSTATPSDDKKPQAAKYGIDATLSILNPGIILIPDYTINATGFNPGSLLSADRIDDANSYLTFVSMALLGTLQNRYGLPTSNYHKSTDLPWEDPANVQGDGCAFAAGLLNFYDGIKFIKDASSPSVASIYGQIESFLGSALDQGCQLGCTLCLTDVSCTTCPTTLRNRDSCTGVNTDTNSCAASGLVMFVNESWLGPP